jgi:hypothetical protein
LEAGALRKLGWTIGAMQYQLKSVSITTWLQNQVRPTIGDLPPFLSIVDLLMFNDETAISRMLTEFELL